MSGEVAALKRSIEGWREIIILTDSVLSWDKVEWTQKHGSLKEAAKIVFFI